MHLFQQSRKIHSTAVTSCVLFYHVILQPKSIIDHAKHTKFRILESSPIWQASMSALVTILLSATDVFAVVLNALVIFTFMKIRSQLTFKDSLLVGMAISDILQCLLGYPLEIYSSEHGHWKFDINSCKV